MKLTAKIITYLSISILIIVIPVSILIWNHQREILYEQSRVQAKTLFEMIVLTRQWVADNRDRVVPVPAIVTKELSEYAKKMSNFRFHITSDKLVNPENRPDEFEKRALNFFKQGGKEYSQITYFKDMGKVYRYMAPLTINSACMKCHQYQGYKIGDLRGGISITIPLESIEKNIIHYNKLFYAFAFIIFIAIVFLVSLLINNLVLKHIKTLKKAADDVMHKKYGKKTNITTNDELAELAKVFDLMSERIEKSEEILKKRLKDSVSKYVHLVEELEEKNKELEKLSQFKTDILDSVAHEIRTPMTKILSYSEMILDPKLSEDKEIIEQAGIIIKRNLLLLRNLFDQMITMNKLDHLQFRYHFELVDINEFLNEVLTYFQKDIKEKEITLTLNLEKEIKVNIDTQAFTYVFNNLLSNAIKYNYNGGKIEITSKVIDNQLYISFYNTGVGIKPEDYENIFSRFFRADNVKKAYAGTGLGLSIAFRIVKDHKGEIKVHSKPGSYAEFTIIIPMNS
jgi:signal transduction histidine kinase